MSKVKGQRSEVKAEKYEPNYEGFFEWCAESRNYPKLFFMDFVKLANLYDACDNEIVKRELALAMHNCWEAWFEKTRHYLLDVVGTAKPEPSHADDFKGRVLQFHRAWNSTQAMKGGAK